MRIRLRLFLLIFGATLLMVSCFLFLLYRNFETSSQKDYASRYESAALVIRNAIMDQEDQLESFSANAANFLKSKTFNEGLPKQEEMAALTSALHVSYLSITDADGRFIRDSVTTPSEKLPGLFSYCEGYKNLINTDKSLETTPILPTKTLKGPFKFTMVAGDDKRHIFEVGMRADFIQKTLSSVISADANILSIGLYSPNGFNYEKVHKNGTSAAGLLDQDIGNMPFGIARSKDDESMTIVTKISAPVVDCCECKIKGVTGEDSLYFYKLVMHVSTVPVHQNLYFIRNNVVIYVVLVAILSFIISCIGGWFVYYRFDRLSEEIGRIMNSGNISNRLDVEGKDEVAAVGRSFDQLLSTIEIAQKELIETEKNRALVTIAKQVAHDIRSPLATLSSITKDIRDDDKGELIKHAVSRIKQIIDDLSSKWKQRESSDQGPKLVDEWIGVKSTCVSLMDEKRIEHHAKQRSLHFSCSEGLDDAMINASQSDFSRALSNLINNAVEAIPDNGNIWVRLLQDDDDLILEVQDDGTGVDEDDLQRIFDKGFSKGKEHGSGLGLDFVQAFVSKYNGQMDVSSQKGKGTVFKLRLPYKIRSTGVVDIVLFEDDPWIRDSWVATLTNAKHQVLTYETPDALLADLDSFRRNSLFFIDLYWDDKLVGFHLAEAISAKGFTEIYICTGVEGANIEPLPGYIKGVVGKNPPGWI